jgi:hypothetical protein
MTSVVTGLMNSNNFVLTVNGAMPYGSWHEVPGAIFFPVQFLTILREKNWGRG